MKNQLERDIEYGMETGLYVGVPRSITSLGESAALGT